MVSRVTSAHMIRPTRELPTGEPGDEDAALTVYLFQQGIIVSPGRSLGPLQSIDQIPLRHLILGREETRPMTQFTAYTTDTAPEAARSIFEGVKGAFGFVPNLQSYMAESPELLERLH
ncbi:hypothetical protein AA103193_2789 [Tanticharoenia sakaeratensis NBRC 103193]|nr:hypothetical protein AA103193_2789 [Tanticharoenia sakaeratensis NBRC 103193]